MSGPPATRDPDRDVLAEEDKLLSQDCDLSRQSEQSPNPITAVTSSPITTRARTRHDDHRPTNSHPTFSSPSRGERHVPHDPRATGMARADEPSPPAGTFLPAAFQEEFLW